MAKRKRKPIPKDESKRDKFKRIVLPRVRKAIKTIRLIGNCSGSAYEYTNKDVAEIVVALSNEVEKLQAKYESKGATTVDFDLD